MRSWMNWRAWLAAAIVTGALGAAPAAAAAGCPTPGAWAQPDGEALDPVALHDELATAEAVLLGERHDRMDHHRWQAATLAALHSRRPDMVIGLEMLPRSAQPALDAWVAGELSPEAFLEESGWYRHWGFNPELYWPVLNFARVHDVPLLALNAERGLVRQLGHEGWDAVPEAERHGVSTPARPREAYREYLERVFERHPAAQEGGLEAFIATQVAWDRMMAAGIAETIEAGGDEPPLVVGVIGSGHLEHGHGVPWQLADLEVEDAPVLLPREYHADCEPAPPGLARAVFGIADDDRFDLPTVLLGVLLEDDGEDGVLIVGVQPGSVAEAAGIEEGDRVLEAGERETHVPSDLQRAVQQVRPGSLLPLLVERDGQREERVARFPRGD